MSTRTTLAVAIGAAAVLAFGAGALAVNQPEPEPQTLSSQPDVKMTYESNEDAPDTPELPGFTEITPRAGSVATVEGPFDDRFDFSGLKLARGTVTGDVTITSDVSELIDLEVVAAFYDADGALLGSSSFIHHGEAHAHSGPPELTEEFEISAPKDIAQRAVSAAVGVPVLVNE